MSAQNWWTEKNGSGRLQGPAAALKELQEVLVLFYMWQHVWTVGKKPFLTKKNIQAGYNLPNKCIKSPKSSWENVFVSKMCVWPINDPLHHPLWGMVEAVSWGCYSPAGTGALVRVEGIMNSSKYFSVLAQIKRNFTLQPTMNPSTRPNQQKNDFTGRKFKFWYGSDQKNKPEEGCDGQWFECFYQEEFCPRRLKAVVTLNKVWEKFILFMGHIKGG